MIDPAASLANLTSRIEDTIQTAGAKAPATKSHIQHAYRSFFKRKIGDLKLMDDHIGMIENLMQHMRQPKGVEIPWMQCVLHERSDATGAAMLEVGPYKFAVVPFPNQAWEDLK